MADVDAELRRYRVDFHSIAVGFAEPGSAFKLKMTFKDDFGDEVPFQKFGYMSFDAFLDDHPDLQRVMVDGKPCYRAKMSERTADIQSLVARQKKKTKKKKDNNGRRGTFQRNVQTRSFQYRPQTPQFNYNNPNQRSLRGGRSTPGPQPGLSRASFTVFPRQPSPFQPYGSGGNAPTTPSQPLPLMGRKYGEGPIAGKARIIAALQRCQGKATITKLNYCYQQLYATQLDKAEMQKYFNTNNFRAIHRDWLADDMDLNPGPSGQWVFLSKEIVRQQRDWADAHKNLIVTEAPQRWDKPTLKELLDKVVAMLANMHPEPLQLSQMAEVYKRAHGVQVDPVELYCKTWEELVKTTFRDRMTLKPNGSIVLTEKGLRGQSLPAKAKVLLAAPLPSIKRVTADDLGLEYSDDSESDEDDDNASIASNSTFNVSAAGDVLNTSIASSRASAPTSSLGHRGDDCAPARLTVSVAPSNTESPAAPRMVRTVFGELVPADPPIRAKPAERKSIFSRLSFAGGKKLPESHPLTDVFANPVVINNKKPVLNTTKNLTKNQEAPLTQNNRPSEQPPPVSKEPPVPKETSSGKGFSFMKTIASRTGFGVKRSTEPAAATSIFSRIQTPDRRTETPYDLWDSSLNGATPNEQGSRLPVSK